MKLIFSIIVMLLYKGVPGPSVERWVIQKTSNLSIEGRSNISPFRCDIKEYLESDTIFLFRDEAVMKPFPIKGGISIPIKGFDCHQRPITHDLRKTLKADEQPLLKINLLNIGYYTGHTGIRHIKGWVNIELAGVTKRAEVDYQVESTGPGFLQLTGTRQVNFSDFGLKPPKKLAGLIKVEQQLDVRFQLVLRSIKSVPATFQIK